MKSIIRIILTLLIVNYSSLITNAQIYVDTDATGSNDGTSWADAYTYLQDALAAASNGDEIWVAEGTYYPDDGASQTDNDRNERFTMISGVSIYGGFNGTETSKLQALPLVYSTILSGDIDQDGVNTNNTYQILYATNLTDKVEINGFIIQKGYAVIASAANGGGLFSQDTDVHLTVKSCVFSDNYAGSNGGAVYCENTASGEMRTVFQNCTFEDNTGYGGGMYVKSGVDALLINCLFNSNYSNGNGGGLYVYSSSNTTYIFATNCTFYNNNSAWTGRGIRLGGSAQMFLTNSIVWNNGSDELTANSSANITVTNSLVKLSSLPSNTTDGGNNIYNQNPLFEDAANDDFQLQTASPALGAGDNSVDLDGSQSGTDTIGGVFEDLAGQPRIDDENQVIDLGVYEKSDCNCSHIMGTNAGTNITTGDANTIYGEEAGFSLTTGSYNSIMGYQAGYSLTSSDSNTIFGYQAGYSTTTGSENIFFGYRAGSYNTLGFKNYFLGSEAGFYNTTGHNNIAIGRKAGYRLSTAYNNIIIGGSNTNGTTITGHNNIFISEDPAVSLTSGSYNIAIGGREDDDSDTQAGRDINTGTYNTLYGAGAGQDIGSGTWNTFLGVEAGFNAEHTDYNTFIGYNSGWDNGRYNSNNDEADYNTAIGSGAGYTARSCKYYVLIGKDADINKTDDENYVTGIGNEVDIDDQYSVALGYQAYLNGEYSVTIGAETDVSGLRSIAIGYNTDINNNNATAIGYACSNTESNSVSIGYNGSVSATYSLGIGNATNVSGQYSVALGSGSTNTYLNSAAIGYGTSVSGNHEIVFGNAATTTIGGTVDFTALSDGRYKTNVQENVVGLDFIRQLRPVTYELKGSDALEASDPLSRWTGFIAQEVEQAAQSLNFNFSGIDYRKNQDLYGLRYAEFVVPLVKSIQELQPKIEEQNKVLEQQKAQLNDYYQQLLELAKELEQLENQ